MKLKKRKKRHDKKQNQLDPPTDNSKHSPKSKNFIKEDEFLKITTLPTEDPDKLKIRGSFNEVSSILKEINQENSYENLEDFLKSLENNPENPFINKKNTHTERVFCRKDKEAESFNEKNMLELIEKRELSLEKNNKYSLQTLDVAREKARNFKNQLNRLLKSIGTCQINEQTKKEIQSLLQEFSLNKYIISQADKSILIKLQDLLLEEKPGSLQDKQRSYSANISNKNVLGFQNPLLPMNSGVNKIRSEIIEENMNDSEVEQDKEGFNLGNKITPGHFSKLNWNYAENVGKALENQSYGNPNNNKIRTKSREKLYSDIQFEIILIFLSLSIFNILKLLYYFIVLLIL